ncbi:Protein FAM8A1 [Oopsacas minuta]|uniref:Protein FAM8A1 n=1 Tax=Oopsacas minuta TaxID=111878 RepID=A0AAV7JXW0_9METZ|nr:Protein FAM8A1 [Oopsacas minuta]
MSESNELLYPMWYSLYSAYLYNMMFMKQAYQMCKDENVNNLTPSKVDRRIIEFMKNANTQSRSTQFQQRPNVMRRVGYKTKRASFLRRLIADLIDQVFVAFILVVSINSFDIAIADILNELNDSSQRIFGDIAKDNTALLFDDMFIFHLMFVLSISSLFIRVFVFVYEWISVWLYGTTIGKITTGLHVVECVEAIPQLRDFIIVKPGLKVGCYSALKRSAVKNFLRHFIPLILCFVTTRGGRTLYDETTQTAVVHKSTCWMPKFEQAEQ